MFGITLPAQECPALPPVRQTFDHGDAGIAVPSHTLARRARGWMLWLVIVALLVWSWGPAEMSRAGSLFTDWRNMAEFGRAFLRPDFRDWASYLADMIITIQIAIWGTALAAILGAPFAILASSNVSPQWIVQPVRRLMDSCRAINEIVFALLFVVAVGLGPFAGVMALFVHNTGIFSKLYSEAVEAIDPRPVEGTRDRRAAHSGSDIRRHSAGRATVDLVHSLPARNQCALRDNAWNRRSGWNRAIAL